MARNFSHKTILSNFSAHTAATAAADRRARISSPALTEWRVEFSHFHHRSSININDNDISRVRRCASWPEPGTKRWLVRILSLWARQSLKKFQHFIVSGTLKMWKLSLNRFQLWLWPTWCRRHCHHSPAWTSSKWTEKRALKIQKFAMTSRISLRFLGKLNLRWDAHYLCIAILSFDCKQRLYKKSFDSRERLPSCQNNSLLLLWWACGKSKYFPLISRKKTRFHSGILIVNERRRRQEFFYFYLHRSFIMKWRGKIRRRILLLCLLLRSSWDRIWKFHKLLHCTVCSNKWFTRAFSSSQSARPSSIVPARSAE